MKDVINNILFITGSGSTACYSYFKAISEICKDILPITSLLTFALLIIINRKSIVDFFKFQSNGKTNRDNK